MDVCLKTPARYVWVYMFAYLTAQCSSILYSNTCKVRSKCGQSFWTKGPAQLDSFAKILLFQNTYTPSVPDYAVKRRITT